MENILKAIAEIEEVVKRYDLGAYINLEDKGRGEFRVVLPSWSICKLQPDGRTIKFEFRKDNWLNGEFTVGMLLSMRDRAKAHFESCAAICQVIVEKMEVSHMEVDLNKKETLQ